MRTGRFQSIQVSLAIAFTALSLTLSVGAVLIAFTVTEETARIASRRYTGQLVRQITRHIESYIGYMDSISALIQADSGVREYLNTAAAASGNGLEPFAASARPALKVLRDLRHDISFIGIYSPAGGWLTADPEDALNPFAAPEKQGWYAAAKEADGAAAVSSSHVQHIIKDRYPWVISLSREIAGGEAGKGGGVLLVDLNFRIIDRICGSLRLGGRGYVFIVDRNGDIVYHPQQQLLYGGLKSESIRRIMEAIEAEETYFPGESGNQDKLYSMETMYSTGWKVVGVNYRGELVENRGSIRRNYALWGLVFLLASMLISIFLSSRLSKPIRELRRSMSAVEQGNFDVAAAVRPSNEIGELGRGFNLMVGEIKKLLKRITLEQEQKRKSELNALQMQINPHFLYNTLDSVIWMAERGKQAEVIAMSSALARLFRLSISKGKEIIDVASEIEHVKNYLTIQKIRYQDRLDYRIQVAEEILEFKIVKIILQPLVENAIYHGIKNSSGAGTVVISGFRTERGMDLVVRDDGAGMDVETLERVRRRLAGKDTPEGAADGDDARPGGGLGIRNVDERIKLYFGPDYGLEFESREHEGAAVFVHLPAIH